MSKLLSSSLSMSCILLILTHLLSCTREEDKRPVVSGSTIVLPANADTSVSVRIIAEDSWTIRNTPDWLSVSPFKGNAGENELSFTIHEANDGIYERESTFELVEGSRRMKYYVIQVGRKGMVLPSVHYEKTFSAGEVRISVITNTSISVDSDSEWATVSRVEYNIDSTLLSDSVTYSSVRPADIIVEVAENSSETEIRKAVFTITCEGVDYEVSLTQVFVSDIEWDKPFDRNTLAIRFTATTCGYCPIMARAFHRAAEEYPDKIIPVSIYGKMSNDTFLSDDYKALFEVFKIDGYPQAVVNAVATFKNYGEYVMSDILADLADEAEEMYPAKTAIEAVCSTNASQINLSCTIHSKDALDYRLHVYLMEDNIKGYQVSYESEYPGGDEYVHSYVQRCVLTGNAGGNAISCGKYGTVTKELAFRISDNAISNIENAYLVAFITYESDTAPTGKVSKAVYTDYGFIIDNAVKIPLNGSIGL